MPRRINEGKYGISHRRYAELKNFCYQYREWRQWLNIHKDTVGGQQIDGMPHASGGHNEPTAMLAMKRQQLEINCRMVEESAIEAGGKEFYKYIFRDVTDENVGVQYLIVTMNMPCGKTVYQEKRRKFFWILNQKKLRA